MAGPDAHVYDPAEGHGLAHEPLNAIIAPRPIGWISSLDANGTANLAPYSFFNAFNYYPPIIAFSTIGKKDSILNIEATGEFCWNLVSRPLAEAMNISCAPAPPEVDEFELAGLTKAPGRKVAAPRVLESPVNFECKVTQILQLKDTGGKDLPTWVVFGQVVMVHIDKAMIADGVYETLRGRPIMRAGRLGDYFETLAEGAFEMVRPGWPL